MESDGNDILNDFPDAILDETQLDKSITTTKIVAQKVDEQTSNDGGKLVEDTSPSESTAQANEQSLLTEKSDIQSAQDSLATDLDELNVSMSMTSTSTSTCVSAANLELSDRLSPAVGLSCEMCTNYEMQLQQMQEVERNLKKQQSLAQSLADRYHTELLAERVMRQELETRMIGVNEQNEQKVNELSAALDTVTNRFGVCERLFGTQLEAAEHRATQLVQEHNNTQTLTDALKDKYQHLLGKHRLAAVQMREQVIDLPQNVDDLQLMCLSLHEQLIECKAAREHSEEALQSEMLLLKDQATEGDDERARREENLLLEVNALRTQLGIAQSHAGDPRQMEEAHTRIAEFQTTISDLESKLGDLQHCKGELEFELKEYQKKCKMLQSELDTGEAVQMDFVKLSQSLQIELEKIRQSEQEVRWQFDEDVYACSACEAAFARAQQKLHCRHCGRVFCDDCLASTVLAGPQRRPARVCHICHTLLCRDVPPFFSQAVPDNSNQTTPQSNTSSA